MTTFRLACSADLDLASNTYIYRTVPVSSITGDLAALTFVAASSDDSLTWLQYSGYSASDAVAVVRRERSVHQHGITCLESFNRLVTSSGKTRSVISAGRDGSTKLWDVDGMKNNITCATPNKQGVSAVAVFEYICGRTLIAVGTELETQGPGDVAVYIWSWNKQAAGGLGAIHLVSSITESHNDTIVNLSFHPATSYETLDANCPSTEEKPITSLVTAGTDGLVNIVNPYAREEDDAIVYVVNTGSPVQHIAVFKEGDTGHALGGNLCIVSQDEKLIVHKITDPQTSQCETHSNLTDLRQTLTCDYVVDLWDHQVALDTTLPMIAVGAYKATTTSEAYVDLYSLSHTLGSTAITYSKLARLPGAHSGEIVRHIWVHPESRVIVSCGEDGSVRFWEPSNEAHPRGVPLENNATGNKSRRSGQIQRRQDNAIEEFESKHRSRYRPY